MHPARARRDARGKAVLARVLSFDAAVDGHRRRRQGKCVVFVGVVVKLRGCLSRFPGSRVSSHSLRCSGRAAAPPTLRVAMTLRRTLGPRFPVATPREQVRAPVWVQAVQAGVATRRLRRRARAARAATRVPTRPGWGPRPRVGVGRPTRQAAGDRKRPASTVRTVPCFSRAALTRSFRWVRFATKSTCA